MSRRNRPENKGKFKEDAASKFEEKLARRLGEIAILVHLARTEEGDHAYEIRSKASDILFKHKREGIEFVENHLVHLLKIHHLANKLELDSDEYNRKKQEIEESLEKCLILKLNPNINRILNRDSSISIEHELEYLDGVIANFEKTKHEIESTTEIWSNISGIYPAIDSLEKNGLIELKAENIDGGRLKKIYGITDLGRKALNISILSMIDITSFIFRVEAHKVMRKEYSDFGVINPFRLLFRRLASDIPHEQRKKIMMRRGRHKRRPFAHMMMEYGLSLPNIHFLLQKPEMIPQFLERLESEEERKMTKEFLKTKLSEHKNEITRILEKIK